MKARSFRKNWEERKSLKHQKFHPVPPEWRLRRYQMDNERQNKKMKDINILDFKSLKILLAGKEDIMAWSYGEVTKPDTINYRTLRPVKERLFLSFVFDFRYVPKRFRGNNLLLKLPCYTT